MANTLSVKYSNTPGAVPTLTPGELAINRADKKLFYTDSLNVLQSVTLMDSKSIPLFKGRASAFRIPGRAGTTGQKLLSLFNASGSTVTVTVGMIAIDVVATVIKAITVLPPVIRLYKVTVLPTGGTALTKTKIGGTSTSNASVTVLGDASADGTNSATALTATLPAGAIITQEFAPRFITAAGYEMADRIEFLTNSDVTLAAGEGVVLMLDYTLATQNPTTDSYVATIQWDES
jgi:hypothetical protein